MVKVWSYSLSDSFPFLFYCAINILQQKSVFSFLIGFLPLSIRVQMHGNWRQHHATKTLALIFLFLWWIPGIWFKSFRLWELHSWLGKCCWAHLKTNFGRSFNQLIYSHNHSSVDSVNQCQSSVIFWPFLSFEGKINQSDAGKSYW